MSSGYKGVPAKTNDKPEDKTGSVVFVESREGKIE